MSVHKSGDKGPAASSSEAGDLLLIQKIMEWPITSILIEIPDMSAPEKKVNQSFNIVVRHPQVLSTIP